MHVWGATLLLLFLAISTGDSLQILCYVCNSTAVENCYYVAEYQQQHLAPCLNPRTEGCWALDAYLQGTVDLTYRYRGCLLPGVKCPEEDNIACCKCHTRGCNGNENCSRSDPGSTTIISLSWSLTINISIIGTVINMLFMKF